MVLAHHLDVNADTEWPFPAAVGLRQIRGGAGPDLASQQSVRTSWNTLQLRGQRLG